MTAPRETPMHFKSPADWLKDIEDMLYIYAKVISSLARPIVTVHGLRYTPDQKAVAEIRSQMEALARRIRDIPVNVEPVNIEAIGTPEERGRATAASKDAQFQRFIGRLLPGQN